MYMDNPNEGKCIRWQIWKVCISRKGSVKSCKQQGMSKGKHLLIDAGTTDDEEFFVRCTERKSLFNTACRDQVVVTGQVLTGKDNIFSSTQWRTDGVVGFPPHKKGMPHGGKFEKFLLRGQVPGNSVFVTNDLLRGHGSYNNNLHVLTRRGWQLISCKSRYIQFMVV